MAFGGFCIQWSLLNMRAVHILGNSISDDHREGEATNFEATLRNVTCLGSPSWGLVMISIV